MEHEERAERLEQDVEQLEEQSERVDEHIRETREDWERKEEDSSVPGAQPDPDEESIVTETPPEESDQLPEEGPGEQVPDDGGGSVRDEARDSPGTPGEEGTATGNPDAAGSDEPGPDD